MTQAVIPSPARPRAVLITGTSGGVGFPTAVHLAQSGWRVFATVRTEEAALRLKEAAPGVEPVHCELRDADSIEACAREVNERANGRLDGLVNNAAMQYNKPLELIDAQTAVDMVATNLLAPIHLIRNCLPMLRAARGRIINVGSIAGSLAAPGANVYSATKAAMRLISSSLWVELQPWGIHVGYIEAGVIDTPMLPNAKDDYREVLRCLTPALEGYRRMFTPETIDKITLFSPARPEDLAEAIGRELTAVRPHRHRYFGKDAKALGFALRFLPASALEALMVRFLFTEKVR
jgi:NAD(P)-dependent dehydrogenase (short-subunit alcohol dehydrogenase family)